MKKFSDITDDAVLDGDKIRIDDVLNEKVVVLNYAVKVSRYSKNSSGKYLILQIEKKAHRHVIFTGSDVLIDQMEKYGTQLPFEATIRKINRYYSLT